METKHTRHILSFRLEELIDFLGELGMPKFRAKQIYQWVYEKGIINLEEMTNLSKKDVETLSQHLDFSLPEISTQQQSSDGTIKWLFKWNDGHETETVFIPGYNRGTLCVSSQVGCTLNCRFCHTGTQGLSRNLESNEIVSQVWIAKKHLGELDKSNTTGKRAVSNLVYMGMGEPLFNWKNVKQSNFILMDKAGFAFGSRKITISTSGMVPNINEIGTELGVNLAISIHAADNETRTTIMPVNKKWPIEELMSAIRSFPLKEHRRITWEYVMLDGINDTDKHARDLVKLIEGIPSFVNIIPFNEWPGSPFKCSKDDQIDKFSRIISRAGIAVNVRESRGDDILAACGQLRGETSEFNSISLEYPSVVSVYGNDKQKIKVNIE